MSLKYCCKRWLLKSFVNKTNVYQVFTDYEKLLISENYVTKRQSLKVRLHLRSFGFCLSLNEATLCVYLAVFLQLLGELLLDRYNFTVMTKYISKPENLKLMMNLLRDNSRNIQFEAFHVFKVEQFLFAVTLDCTCVLFCPNSILFTSQRFLLQTQTRLSLYWTYC